MSKLFIASRIPIWALSLIASSANSLLTVYENQVSTIERDILLAKVGDANVVSPLQVNPSAPLQRSVAPGRSGPEDDLPPIGMPS